MTTDTEKNIDTGSSPEIVESDVSVEQQQENREIDITTGTSIVGSVASEMSPPLQQAGEEVGTDVSPHGGPRCKTNTEPSKSVEFFQAKILQDMETQRDTNTQHFGRSCKIDETLYNAILKVPEHTEERVREKVQNLEQELTTVGGQLLSLQDKVKELEGTLKFTSNFVQKTEDERVKTLYAENEKYKAGLVKRFEDELLTNVIRQIDEAEKTIRHIESRISAGVAAEKVLISVHEIITDFKDMLQDRYGLTEFTSDVDTTADEQHRITPRKEITAENELNGKIAKSVTCGYKDREGKVFRQESVVLYKYEPSATAQPENDEEPRAEIPTLNT